MHSQGFSVTEESSCLTLCIAWGKMSKTFFITMDKNCPKVEDIFKTIFINVTKNCLQDISESMTVLPCEGVSAIGSMI